MLTCAVHFGLMGHKGVNGRESAHQDSVRQLLLEMRLGHRSTRPLAALFQIGDEKIEELIKALDDPEPLVRLNAQIVIRYLANDAGLEALSEGYANKKALIVTAPFPVPLKDWDYNFISSQYLNQKPALEPMMESYLFALALDGSSRAGMKLREVIENAKKHGVGLREDRYLQTAGIGVIRSDEQLATSVLGKASFININERKHATAKVIAYNGARNRAIVEIHVNKGPLAEVWYHIVLGKSEQVWKFLSITQVAVS